MLVGCRTCRVTHEMSPTILSSPLSALFCLLLQRLMGRRSLAGDGPGCRNRPRRRTAQIWRRRRRTRRDAPSFISFQKEGLSVVAFCYARRVSNLSLLGPLIQVLVGHAHITYLASTRTSTTFISSRSSLAVATCSMPSERLVWETHALSCFTSQSSCTSRAITESKAHRDTEVARHRLLLLLPRP